MQNDTDIEAMDSEIDVDPSRSFIGTSKAKSFSWYLEVRIKSKKAKTLSKAESANDKTVKTMNTGSSSIVKVHLSLLILPGRLNANATMKTSAATNQGVVGGPV